MINRQALSQALNITPAIEEKIEVTALTETKVNSEEVKNDKNYARENLYKIVETGMDAIEKIADLADQTQQFKGYDALANMMKATKDANKDLLEIQQLARDLGEKADPDEQKKITNNLFIGSTKELADYLSNRLDHK